MQFPSVLLPLIPLAAAHGYVSSPTARTPGPAGDAACGKMAMDDIRKDKTSHVEGLPELAAKDSDFRPEKCNLWLCKGMQYDDNSNHVQTYSPGEEVHMTILLTIPHDGGANVSIVDTATDTIIGDMLKVWDSGYANEKLFYTDKLPEDQVDFMVTIPEDEEIAEKCTTAGACVLQWWWYGTGAKQTYESCVGFVVS